MELLKRLNPIASGNKTYAVAILTIAYVLVGVYLKEGLNVELLAIALTALGIRNAIK